jgi:hypothetical protein
MCVYTVEIIDHVNIYIYIQYIVSKLNWNRKREKEKESFVMKCTGLSIFLFFCWLYNYNKLLQSFYSVIIIACDEILWTSE